MMPKGDGLKRHLIPTKERLLDSIAPEPNTGCWLWIKYRKPQGYGQLSIGNRNEHAHRVSYMVFRGPIAAGFQLDHLCRTPQCINPWHLEIVTPKVNSQRGYWGTKTACIHGHEYTGDNFYINIRGKRTCRVCSRAYQKRLRERF
jgi:hypothetical protein